jgi:hypothetical protein
MNGREIEAERGGLTALPSFAAGGRVDRTGIALVHEGEYIVPARGSEALVTPVSVDTEGTALTLNFPVEVEVIGELNGENLAAISEHIYEELEAEFRARPSRRA